MSRLTLQHFLRRPSNFFSQNNKNRTTYRCEIATTVFPLTISRRAFWMHRYRFVDYAIRGGEVRGGQTLSLFNYVPDWHASMARSWIFQWLSLNRYASFANDRRMRWEVGRMRHFGAIFIFWKWIFFISHDFDFIWSILSVDFDGSNIGIVCDRIV